MNWWKNEESGLEREYVVGKCRGGFGAFGNILRTQPPTTKSTFFAPAGGGAGGGCGGAGGGGGGLGMGRMMPEVTPALRADLPILVPTGWIKQVASLALSSGPAT